MNVIIKHFFSLLKHTTLVILLTISLWCDATANQQDMAPSFSSSGYYPTRSKLKLDDADVSRFTNTLDLINDFYVNPINEKTLLENAIRGIVAGLDPHSEYLDEAAYKALMVETSGAFSGIGVDVTSDYDVLRVISPIDGTPAAQAGIKPGDYIVAINGKLVSSISLQEAVNSIQGRTGSQINLTIIRKGINKPLTFSLRRDIIHIDSVTYKLLEPGLAYIRISQFHKLTPALLVKAIHKLQKQAGSPLKGLLLDLRNNPGGLLDSAVKITNIFLNSKTLPYEKLIVYTKGQLPELQYVAHADTFDILKGAPMVILVNEGSASASEITAGALQDYHRAIVVGITSNGKGSVQTVVPIDATHAIKLTTALYFTPAGRQIQNQGIEPNINIEPLKVVPDPTASFMRGPIREFELRNHLKSVTHTLPIEDQSSKPDYSDLAENDFQLYQAIKVLQTAASLAQTN